MAATRANESLHPSVDAVRRAEGQLNPRLVDLKRECPDLRVAVGTSHREVSSWILPCYDVFTRWFSDSLPGVNC